ncbi:MAG: hypothetical protein MK183_03465 [Verrucomicrobiales bacterium]|nr:hypothetical protein [Verrucomicrobiales bacterium]
MERSIQERERQPYPGAFAWHFYLAGVSFINQNGVCNLSNGIQMDLSALEQTLSSLKSTRMLSGEAQAAIAPFREQVLRMGISFVSASSTHSTQLGNEYNGGYTVIGRIDDWDVEISTLLVPGENERVENLKEGEACAIALKVLDYDSLYQRVIFGQVLEGAEFTPEPTPEPEPAAITPVPLEPDPVMVDRIEQLQKQFRDAGVGHIHVSSAMSYSAREAEDPALMPAPVEVTPELTSELPLEPASRVIERVDKLQQQFRDAGAVDPALTPEVADMPEAAGNDILCPNNHCRYKGTGKWMRAQGNKAGNGIAAMMTGIIIMIGLVFSKYLLHVVLSLVVFGLIPAKYRKMSWQEMQKDPSGKAVGTLLTIAGVGSVLSLLSGFFFWIFFSLGMVFLIRWGSRKIKAGSSVELGCPKCRTPWGVYPRRAVQNGVRKLP